MLIKSDQNAIYRANIEGLNGIGPEQYSRYKSESGA
jgi:hypothetical protein